MNHIKVIADLFIRISTIANERIINMVTAQKFYSTEMSWISIFDEPPVLSCAIIKIKNEKPSKQESCIQSCIEFCVGGFFVPQPVCMTLSATGLTWENTKVTIALSYFLF